MDNDHGITGELRELAEDALMRLSAHEDLTAIADRIDAEHERTMAAAALIAGVPMTDENMAEHGWVKLPVDADGEYIHVGDMLVDGLSQDFAPKKVKMLMLEGNEWMLNFGAGWQAMKNHEWHHHAPDTWERIIEDARAYSMKINGSYLWKNKTDELVARCKALAGDAE